MSFPRYPEYKDSGVDWLGDLPSHWDLVPLKYLVRFVGGGTPDKSNHAYWAGDIPWLSPKDMRRDLIRDTRDKISETALSESSTCMVPAESVVLVFRSGILRSRIPVAVAMKSVALNQDMKALVGFPCPFYLMFLIQSHSPQLLHLWRQQGATVESLEYEQVANTAIPVPPRGEQIAITAFLNHETAKIDTLIEEQQRLIELLREKRQAVISHAVTKGLDPGASMKDSGVEWLGEVPAHWSVTRVKHITHSFEQGWSPQCESVPVDGDQEWGILKVGCVNYGEFNPYENKRLPADLEPAPELGVRKGDVLISRANTRELVGSATVAEIDCPRLMVCDKLYRLRTQPECRPKYLSYYLGIDQVRPVIEIEATGASSSMLNIGQDVIKELPIPLPPLVDQNKIVSWLGSQLKKIRDLQKEAVESMKLLQERRSALISAATTGKIDVRNWQPETNPSEPLPMVAEKHAVYDSGHL